MVGDASLEILELCNGLTSRGERRLLRCLVRYEVEYLPNWTLRAAKTLQES